MKYTLLLLFILHSLSHVAQQQSKEINLDISFHIECDSGCRQFKLISIIPQSIANRQDIKELAFSSFSPQRLYYNQGNCYAEFIIENPLPKFEIIMKVKAMIYKSDYKSLSNIQQPLFLCNLFSPYLKAEKFIESDSSQIKAIAQLLRRKTRLETVKNIYDFCMKHITYIHTPYSKGALQALNSREGDCTEFTDLFIALCRANSIPAKYINGYTTASSTIPHAWAEVYFENLGWIPFDPTPGNSQQFDNISNLYIYLSSSRNETELDNYQIYYYKWKGKKAKVIQYFNFYE